METTIMGLLGFKLIVVVRAFESDGSPAKGHTDILTSKPSPSALTR